MSLPMYMIIAPDIKIYRFLYSLIIRHKLQWRVQNPMEQYGVYCEIVHGC